MVRKFSPVSRTVIKSRLASLLDRYKGAEDLDVSFYERHYGDLIHLRDHRALKRHFIEHGRAEGRFANARALIDFLEAKYGALPSDFDPKAYKALHDDLGHISDDASAMAHYLQFGRAEGRTFRRDVALFDQELRKLELANPGKNYSHFKNFDAFLLAFGVRSSNWISKFNLGDFIFLNQAWLPSKPKTKIEGITLFVDGGIERLAPISNSFRFHADFYRTVTSVDTRDQSDADLYRHWLNLGAEQGEASNEGEFLLKLIGDESFPACFDERTYRASDKGKPGIPPGRARALEHYITIGFKAAPTGYIVGNDADLLYTQISKYYLTRNQMPLALTAIEKALEFAPFKGHLHHTRGDILKALGREADAVEAFVHAANQPNSTVWSHIHAVDGILSHRNDHSAALEMIATDAPEWHGFAPWRTMAHRVIDAAFGKEERHAHELYVKGHRSAGDSVLQASLARTTSLIERVDPLPTPLPIPRTGPVVIIANRDLPQCDHYRVTQKYLYLKHGGWSVEIYDQNHVDAFRPALDRARTVIFYRVVARPAIIHAILYARSLGIQTIYEIDDLIFDADRYPDPFESFDGQITIAEYAGLQLGVPLFRHAMQLCDIGLVTTPALADAVAPLVRDKVCHVLRNGLDLRNASALDAAHLPFSSDWVTLFYGSGTKAHGRDFTELAAPALLTALSRHRNVRLVFVGHVALDDRFSRYLDRIFIFSFDANVESYWELLSGSDINIAVLNKNAATNAKSEIKWLEAAVYAIPSIVSDTRTYSEALIDGEDALIAGTPEAWIDAVERLVGQPDLRRRIGSAAQRKALARYTPAAAVDQLSRLLPKPAAPKGAVAATDVHPDHTDFLERARLRLGVDPTELRYVKESNAAHAPARRRVLLVHVYFPPEIIGGATRVLQDNVDYLLDNFGDDIELAVVTTDSGVEPAYRTRIESYRGIPVYRIAVKQRVNMDWHPFDPGIAEPFQRIFERFAPDLVHYHCIQRLTATVVEPVLRAGTPYIITLHDAWWISDHQFLFDDDNQPHDPGPDPIRNGWNPAISHMASVSRHRKLSRLLNGAHALVAVSEKFAEIYRRAGYPQTRVIANGVSRFMPHPRSANTSGRVRLGHIGNRSAHKGATLIEIVLKSTDFTNLTLTMVEAGREPGYSRKETWGTTPVELIGPTPQAEIANLYAGLDVLLAPSLWPESFGLVSREAKAAGLWVVASDIGSIGEEIEEGVDGYRIDVSTLEGLRHVLLAIDASPERHTTAPPSVGGAMRTSDDQGAEIMCLYKDITGSEQGRYRSLPQA